MAAPTGTPPGTPPAITPEPTTGATPESILATTIAYQSLMDSYKQFADILKNQGAAAAMEYANAITYAQSKALELSQTIGGFTDALQNNSRKAAEAYGAIKREIKDQAEQVADLTIKINKYEEAIENFKRSDTGGFNTLADQIEDSREELEKLFDNLDRSGQKDTKLAILRQVQDLRSELNNIKAADVPAKVAAAKEKFIKERILQGADVDSATRQFDSIRKAVEKEAELKRTPRSGESQAHLQTLLDLHAAQERLMESMQRGQDAADSLPVAKSQKTFSNAIEKTNEQLTNLIDRMSGAANTSNVFSSAMVALAGPGGIGALAKSISESLSNSFLVPEKAASRLVTFIDTFLIKSTFKFDETLANVNKTTGGFRGEFEKITLNKKGLFTEQALGDLYKYGINLERMAKSYSDLSREVGGFNNFGLEQKRILTENAAMLENLNVSSVDYSKSVTYFMGVIGQTAEGSAIAINRLTDSAIAAGKNVGDYVKEFNQLSSKLTGFGQDAENIFRRLNSVAQATKGAVSASDLAGLSEHFKDYETAARSAFKLSGVLRGVSLDPKSMVGKDPMEILTAMKKAYDIGQHGVPFEKLFYGQKRDLASFFGGDIARAQTIFNMKLSDATKEMRYQSEAEKERLKRIEESTAAMKKFETAIENMKLSFTPLIKSFTGIANLINKMSQDMGPGGVFAAGVAGLTFLLNRSFRALGSGLQGIFTRVLSGVRAEIANISRQISTLSAAPGARIPGGVAPTVPGAPIPGGGRFGGTKRFIGNLLVDVGRAAIAYKATDYLMNKGAENAEDGPQTEVDSADFQRSQQNLDIPDLEQLPGPPPIPRMPDIVEGSGEDAAYMSSGTPVLPNSSGRLSRQAMISASGRNSGDEGQFIVRGRKVFNLNPEDNILAFKTNSILRDRESSEFSSTEVNLDRRLEQSRDFTNISRADRVQATAIERIERIEDKIRVAEQGSQQTTSATGQPFDIDTYMEKLRSTIETSLARLENCRFVAVIPELAEKRMYTKFQEGVMQNLASDRNIPYST